MDAIFKEHPSLKEYFQTSDGENFYMESDAKNHAKSLKDKTVTPFKREVEKSVEENEDIDDEKIIYPEDLSASSNKDLEDKSSETKVELDKNSNDEVNINLENSNTESDKVLEVTQVEVTKKSKKTTPKTEK